MSRPEIPMTHDSIAAALRFMLNERAEVERLTGLKIADDGTPILSPSDRMRLHLETFQAPSAGPR